MAATFHTAPFAGMRRNAAASILLFEQFQGLWSERQRRRRRRSWNDALNRLQAHYIMNENGTRQAFSPVLEFCRATAAPVSRLIWQTGRPMLGLKWTDVFEEVISKPSGGFALNPEIVLIGVGWL